MVKTNEFYVKLIKIGYDQALDKMISRNFDPLMNNIRILYLTKGAGKYQILIPREGQNYFPERPKGQKYVPERP